MAHTTTSTIARYFILSQWKNMLWSTFNTLVLLEILLILSSSSVFLYAFKEPTLFGFNYFFLLFICVCLGMGVYARMVASPILMAMSMVMAFVFAFLLWCDHWLLQLDLFDFVRDYFWIHSGFLFIIIKKQAKCIWYMARERKKKNQSDASNLTPVHVYIHGHNTPRRRAMSEDKSVL